MRRLIIIAFILAATMLQMSIFSQFKIQSGKADLLLLVVVALGLQPEINKLDNYLFSGLAGMIVGFISAEPFWIVVLVYLLAVNIAFFFKERLPQIPIVSMFIISVLAMFLHLALQSFYYQFLGFDIVWDISFQKLILPSLMINIIATLPVYFIASEIRRMVFPTLEEV